MESGVTFLEHCGVTHRGDYVLMNGLGDEFPRIEKLFPRLIDLQVKALSMKWRVAAENGCKEYYIKDNRNGKVVWSTEGRDGKIDPCENLIADPNTERGRNILRTAKEVRVAATR